MKGASILKEVLTFGNRQEFRDWLIENSRSSEGVWLKFWKTRKANTLKAAEALEEALCFGWIDGVMKKIDEDHYLKYFALRRKNSKWSAKNKDLVTALETKGIMTDLGREKIKEAQQNGQWEQAKRPSDISEEQIQVVRKLLAPDGLAYENFMGMSLSIQKTYTRAYFDAKTESGQEKRLAWMLGRLRENLKPM